MDKLLKLLVEGLEKEERDLVVRRVEAMDAELQYLSEKKPKQIEGAAKRGWSPRKLYVVFCLNSFYQRILAPLWASAISPAAVGSEIPIRYGNFLVFDAARNRRMDKMGSSFIKLCREARIERWMLESQRTSDLIYSLNNSREGADAETDSK